MSRAKVVVIEEKKYWTGTLISLLDIMLSLSLVKVSVVWE